LNIAVWKVFAEPGIPITKTTIKLFFLNLDFEIKRLRCNEIFINQQSHLKNNTAAYNLRFKIKPSGCYEK